MTLVKKLYYQYLIELMSEGELGRCVLVTSCTICRCPCLLIESDIFSLSLSHKKTDFITLFIALVSLTVTHFLYDLNDLIPNIQKGNSLCCVFCLAPFLVCVSNYLDWINLDLDLIKLFDSSRTK